MYTCCQTYHSLVPCSLRMNDGTWRLAWKCKVCESYYDAEFNTNTVNIVISDLVEIPQDVLDNTIDVVEHEPLDKFQLKNVLSGIDLFKEARDANFITNIDTNGVPLECPNCLYEPLHNDAESIICNSCGTLYRLTLMAKDNNTGISKYLIIGKELRNYEEVESDEVAHTPDEEIDEYPETTVGAEEESTENDDTTIDEEDVRMYGLGVEDTDDVISTNESVFEEEPIISATKISDIPYEGKASIKRAAKLFTPEFNSRSMDATSITSGVRTKIDVVFKSGSSSFPEEYDGRINIYNTKTYEILLDSIGVSTLPEARLEYQYNEQGHNKLSISECCGVVIDPERIIDIVLHEETRDSVIRANGVFILPMVKIHIINETTSIVPDKLRDGYLYVELSSLVNFNIKYHKGRV